MDYAYNFINNLLAGLALVVLLYVVKEWRSTSPDDGLPTVHNLKAQALIRVGGRATISVKPSRLYDDTGFKKIEEELDRRMAEVDCWSEKQYPGWSRTLYP